MLKYGGVVAALALALALSSAGVLRADSVIVGSPSENGLCIPFGCDNFGPSTVYQQVYANTAFPQPITIRTISFFNTLSPTGSILYGNYQISLSTTAKAVGQLSTNFAQNIGGDNQVFYNGILSGSPNGQFTVAGLGFNYNPSLGNLLLDIQRTPLAPPEDIGSGGIAFDGMAFNAGTSFSWMHNYSTLVFPGFGLTTEFTDSVPEPGTIALMVGGLLSLLIVRHFRKRRALTAAVRNQ